MIENVRGDILKSPAEALVNTVNTVGFMGRGIALQFKKAFPANNADYVAACKRGEVQPGRMLVHETRNVAGPRFIINFPTKRHWRGRSRLEDIDAGLEALVAEVRDRGIRSIAIPPLGAGLGGLDWGVVRPRIEASMRDLANVRVWIYEPTGAPDPAVMARTSKVPRMTPGRASLIALMARYLEAMMDASVSLLELHKLMYFMQLAGQDLRLRFAKATYGPYAENLRHVLSATEGHFTSGYAEGGDVPNKPIGIVPGALEDAEKQIALDRPTQENLDKVVRLVQGFESPFGMELLASVHWVAGEGASTSDDAVQAMHRWNERKRRFTPEQIAVAWTRLESQGWIAATVTTPDES